ncbi:hypothetical protein PVK06_039230 [Gossypium arboreum]|uniref:Uncharacterized protein n=1 Tax=Gossypium arboreum TaxID=29729 RepID=A0ABR0N2C3_GOSAR|nr:hypothetical protein PVK06_039230 [Gossypium arboreum]
MALFSRWSLFSCRVPCIHFVPSRSCCKEVPVQYTFAMEVESGKTYLLRIINAALNDDLFFAISGHNMIYFMAARPFMDAPLPADNKTATAILQYKGIPNIVLPTRPQLPASNDTDFALSYNKKLRSLNSAKFPAIVPLKVDRKLFYTVGFGKDLCTTCVKGTRLLASLNNISFVMPKIGLLQAHYFNTKRVFRTDFPDKPPKPFNYTVELALQDTNLLKVESHPFHLHGCNFFVIGTGIGNFDPVKDPSKFNLVDPIERNTVGVWFMHYHLELDTGWGLKMAFVVEDGTGADQSIQPPSKDLPPCYLFENAYSPASPFDSFESQSRLHRIERLTRLAHKPRIATRFRSWRSKQGFEGIKRRCGCAGARVRVVREGRTEVRRGPYGGAGMAAGGY